MNRIDQVSQIFIVRNHFVDVRAIPEKVWPFLLAFERFNPTFESVELLAGKKDTVGAISLLTKEQGDMYMPPYLIKIVELKPERQIVWKMYPGSGDDFYCFVDFKLTPQDGGTRFSGDVYAEYQFPILSDGELAQRKASIHAMYDRLMAIALPNLKTLAESQ